MVTVASLQHPQVSPPCSEPVGCGTAARPTLEESLICISFSSYYQAAACESVLTAAVSKLQVAAIASDWLKTLVAACGITARPSSPFQGGMGMHRVSGREESPLDPQPPSPSIISNFLTPAREGNPKRPGWCLVFYLIYFI